jgi:hypothetical protein
MRTLLNDRDQKEVLDRLSKVRPDRQRRWGSMSAQDPVGADQGWEKPQKGC